MLVIVGFVIVLASIVGGYLLEGGNLRVLLQPAELIIIGGASLGSLIVANSATVLKELLWAPQLLLRGSPYTQSFYLSTIQMMNEFFSEVRKKGMAGVESHIEDPQNSDLFKRYPAVLAKRSAIQFFCDTIRTVTTGAVSHHDLDQLMETDIETIHKEAHVPVHSLTVVADGLPGLGIVAAVLGIILTMGALGGPPEQIGHRVAAALVGTFLGVLLCYGFVGPMAARLGKLKEEETEFLQCLRVGISSFVKGAPPILAVEFARRSIPTQFRPSFQQVEDACRNSPATAQEAA
jgi:chemotaxis protein MotA